MSVSLRNNFLKNSRGITFKDTATVVWSINANTNEITAVGSTGTVGSVGLADGSSTPVYNITNSPVTGSGTLTFTLKTQSINTVFAGPGSGAAAQPTFRGLVAADIPDLGANPGVSSGLTAVNGTAKTYLRSDGAPAISQAIAPTWTGRHIFNPVSGSTQFFSSSVTTPPIQVETGNTGTATNNGVLALVNVSASAQTPIDFFTNTTTLTGRIRNDFAGNINYAAFLSGAHDFFCGGDSGTGVLSFAISSGVVNLAGHATTITAPAAGGAGALPATPKGYVTIQINGTAQKVAYY